MSVLACDRTSGCDCICCENQRQGDELIAEKARRQDREKVIDDLINERDQAILQAEHNKRLWTYSVDDDGKEHLMTQGALNALVGEYKALRKRYDKDRLLLRAALNTTKSMVEMMERPILERDEAIAVAIQYGGIDGAHHKMWVIDQMLRKLTGDGYGKLVKMICSGEDGPDTYTWDCGVAP